MSLTGKRIVVGVSGSIAAFKAVALTRELTRRGAQVRVALTQSAARFVGPVTFSGLTANSVVSDLWDPKHAGEVHVELAGWADAILVAPATANLLARAAGGIADDAVLATLCCATCPVLYAPAMHESMWRSASNQRNVRTLSDLGARMVGPEHGALASGEQGMGRMAEPETIAEALEQALGPRDLAGKRIVISAGPTIEDIDPVRFLSNRSSGRMGYALARRARARGARTVLISGPVELAPPSGVKTLHVRSALEMQAAMAVEVVDADAAIMAAAVADYRPEHASEHKLKKADETLSLRLVPNPDILAGLGHARTGKRPVLVGFAMESRDMVQEARRKLQSKRVDLVVANKAETAFGGERTEAVLVSDGMQTETGPVTKSALSDAILDRVREMLSGLDSASTRDA